MFENVVGCCEGVAIQCATHVGADGNPPGGLRDDCLVPYYAV